MIAPTAAMRSGVVGEPRLLGAYPSSTGGQVAMAGNKTIMTRSTTTLRAT
jgi:hypothetical protein